MITLIFYIVGTVFILIVKNFNNFQKLDINCFIEEK